MKMVPHPNLRSSTSGGTLLVVIMVAGILTFGAVSYLALTSQTNKAVMRSMHWNAAMALAEAGI